MSILSGPKPVSFVRDGVELFRITYPDRDARPHAGDIVTNPADGWEWRVKSIASGLGVIATAEIEDVLDLDEIRREPFECDGYSVVALLARYDALAAQNRALEDDLRRARAEYQVLDHALDALIGAVASARDH